MSNIILGMVYVAIGIIMIVIGIHERMPPSPGKGFKYITIPDEYRLENARLSNNFVLNGRPVDVVVLVKDGVSGETKGASCDTQLK